MQAYERLKKENINNSLVKHNLEANHGFNFKDFKMLVYIHNENKFRKSLYLVSFIATILSTKEKTWSFQFVSLFGQVGAVK